MSNPAMPGPVGAAGAMLVGISLTSAGVRVESGYWLALAAWIASAVVSLVFEESAFALPSEIPLGSIATVELEDDDEDATGPTSSTASLSLCVPSLPPKLADIADAAVATPGRVLRRLLPSAARWADATGLSERLGEWLALMAWPESLSIDRPFIVLVATACALAWWHAPYATIFWASWGAMWWLWLGAPTMCCLEWLPNEG